MCTNVDALLLWFIYSSSQKEHLINVGICVCILAPSAHYAVACPHKGYGSQLSVGERWATAQMLHAIVLDMKGFTLWWDRLSNYRKSIFVCRVTLKWKEISVQGSWTENEAPSTRSLAHINNPTDQSSHKVRKMTIVFINLNSTVHI